MAAINFNNYDELPVTIEMGSNAKTLFNKYNELLRNIKISTRTRDALRSFSVSPKDVSTAQTDVNEAEEKFREFAFEFICSDVVANEYPNKVANDNLAIITHIASILA
jgi:hypothetical protein